MNIQMRGADEWIDGKSTGNLGEVLIRYVTSHLAWNGLYWPGQVMWAGSDKKGMHVDRKPNNEKNSRRTMLT